MELELLTDRLLLRPLRVEDIDLAMEMFTDPDVVRYVGGLETPEQIEAGMPTWTRRCGGGCIGIWCVTDRVTSEKFGTSILLPMPIEETDTDWSLVEGPGIPDGEIEVGYILKKSAWGKGYATEVCTRLLAFAFEETPLTEVVACIDAANDKSGHVLLKCGLVGEGKRRAYGEHIPCFRITREQWLAANRS